MTCLGLNLQAKGLSAPLGSPLLTSTKPATKGLAQAKAKPAASAKTTQVATVTTTTTVTHHANVGMAPSIFPPSRQFVTTTVTQVATTTSTKGAAPRRSVDAPVAAAGNPDCARLARLTAYWASEGDFYTKKGVSSTGVRLHGGHCAVDPRIIPYGSVVEIQGIGRYLAVDTGSAVISREAAREAAHTTEERQALVVDLYFESRMDGEKFAAGGPKYAAISWWPPASTEAAAREARTLFADENWTKIQSKQL